MGDLLGAGAFAGTSAPLLKSYSLMGETETQLSYLARISCTVRVCLSPAETLCTQLVQPVIIENVEVQIGR